MNMEKHEEMVQKAAAAMRQEFDEWTSNPTAWMRDPRAVNMFLDVMASAALEAALGDVEPLEDVLGTSTVTVTRVDFGDWYSEITEPRVMKAGGHGPTIDAAVRAAVANAKGGEG